jgi:hypothetical protein
MTASTGSDACFILAWPESTASAPTGVTEREGSITNHIARRRVDGRSMHPAQCVFGNACIDRQTFVASVPLTLRPLGVAVGLLAKSATKKRVAPSSGPVNTSLSGTPWLTTGAIPAGALVRSAVFALDLTGARSSQSRGRTSSFAPTSASQLWVESFDFRTWRFILGVARVPEGIAADWLVELTINDDQSATVATTSWLTKDDELVHGAHHDALRTELLRALALGQMTDAGGEADVTATSLNLVQPFERPGPDAFELVCSYETSLAKSDARDRIRLMGHPVIKDATTGVRHGLGLPKYFKNDFVDLTLRPGVVALSARVSSDTATSRRMSSADLRAYVKRLHFLLKNKDENVQYQGPAEWSP